MMMRWSLTELLEAHDKHLDLTKTKMTNGAEDVRPKLPFIYYSDTQ